MKKKNQSANKKYSRSDKTQKNLRKRAEELLAGKSKTKKLDKTFLDTPHADEEPHKNQFQRVHPEINEQAKTDIKSLIHELRVHRIELEMQNEELRKAQLELEESRSKYSDLYDFAPLGYCTLDKNGIILEINLTGATMLGVEKKYLIKKRFSQYIASENQDSFYSFRKRLIATNARQTCELRVLRKDGKPFYAQLEGVAMFNSSIPQPALRVSAHTTRSEGNFSHFRVAMLDITERKQAEEEMLRAQKLESLGVLAGGIAHEFNNLLTVILGNVSLARMITNPEVNIFQRLVEVEKVTLRAKGLTEQLLTFAKGGAPIKTVTISMAEIIKDSVRFALTGSDVNYRLYMPDPSTEPSSLVGTDSGSGLWPVEVDEGQIAQVINNLIINAKQAMPDGGMIKVSAENINLKPGHALYLKEGRYVKVTIQDQGIGIPKQHINRIFDPYFTTKQRGSGLGLAAAYSIIKSHGGCITVDSDLGVGTTFVIYLPASEKEIFEKVKREGKTLLVKGKILVMDDDEVVREIVGEMLYHIGCEVEFATDGREAIELYKRARESEKSFDAVILDLTVPGAMGGKDAMKILLQIDPDVRAIVSSGYSNDPVMTEFSEYGFSGVVAKPYKIDELSEALHKVIKG